MLAGEGGPLGAVAHLVPLSLTTLAVGFAAGLGIWRWNARTWRRRVDGLYSRIVAAVARSVDEPAPLPPRD